MNSAVTDTWGGLRAFTRARIALGRSGVSLPTQEVLAFSLAHAQARDAVHLPLDMTALGESLAALGIDAECLASAAPDRAAYLQRPDWGRRLSGSSRERLMALAREGSCSRVLVLADGLSSLAVARHGAPFLAALRACLPDWNATRVLIATQARVALGDEIGHLLGAEQVVMLIGERPGLSSPDSLGLYLTQGPRPGLSDAARNCISNVRPEGLAYDLAAQKLAYLMAGAKRLGKSGVDLKDDSEIPLLDRGVQEG